MQVWRICLQAGKIGLHEVSLIPGFDQGVQAQQEELSYRPKDGCQVLEGRYGIQS